MREIRFEIPVTKEEYLANVRGGSKSAKEFALMDKDAKTYLAYGILSCFWQNINNKYAVVVVCYGSCD